jgi:hypothetical protein
VNFGTQCDGDKAATCFGGFPRQATAVNAARAAAAQRGVDTLVLHAGDQFTGSIWDAVYTKNGDFVATQFLVDLGVQAFVSVGLSWRELPALPLRLLRCCLCCCLRSAMPGVRMVVDMYGCLLRAAHLLLQTLGNHE